jgi:hypothetical protein
MIFLYIRLLSSVTNLSDEFTSQNDQKTYDLPTPESPIRTTYNRGNQTPPAPAVERSTNLEEIVIVAAFGHQILLNVLCGITGMVRQFVVVVR